MKDITIHEIFMNDFQVTVNIRLKVVNTKYTYFLDQKKSFSIFFLAATSVPCTISTYYVLRIGQ